MDRRGARPLGLGGELDLKILWEDEVIQVSASRVEGLEGLKSELTDHRGIDRAGGAKNVGEIKSVRGLDNAVLNPAVSGRADENCDVHWGHSLISGLPYARRP